MSERLFRILDSFREKNILVVGDVMTDKWLYGSAERVSPEAPVIVVKVEKEEESRGGAGNTARNIEALGAKATLLGSKEKDCVKVRVIAREQQIARLDYDDFGSAAIEIPDEKFDAIIVSDYGKGAVNKENMEKIGSYRSRHAVPLVIDPNPPNSALYPRDAVVVPNEKEWKEMANKNFEVPLVTRGKDGIQYKDKTFPAFAREVFDVTGAGDTVAATVALSLASNASIEEACVLANYAAGIVVGRHRTACCSVEELKSEIGKRAEGK